MALLRADWRGYGDGSPTRQAGGYIAIKRPIGAGKTSLAQALGLKNRRTHRAQRYRQ